MEDIIFLYNKLFLKEIFDNSSFENWILEKSEIDAAVDQKRSILFIEMTCDTENPEKSKEYQDFIENIVPGVKEISQKLDKKLLNSLSNLTGFPDRYSVYIKRTKNQHEIFHDANIPLQTQESMQSRNYQQACASMMVEFNNEKYTLQRMQKFLEHTNRETRESAWRASQKRRLAESAKLDDIFDKLLSLRQSIAKNSGFQTFRDYQFKALSRFDYTPKDCTIFHKNIYDHIVPLYKDILLKRKSHLKLTELRPWDLAVDPFSDKPLHPFDNISQLIDGTNNIFQSIDYELGDFFKEIRKLGLLDLENRKGKAPGGYQSGLSEIRKPFIFMNAVGMDNDVRTLLHESGHSFHTLLSAKEPLADYRDPPIEFCEVASMSMEMIGNKYLNVFYNPEEIKRSVLKHFEDVIFIFPWVAIVDSFQHWLYENPVHTHEERNKIWIEIYNKYTGGVVNWEGLENEKEYIWHKQLHIFQYPFYYIEYAIAQLGALQVWQNHISDHKHAINKYKYALSFGGSLPLPELFKKADINFDFSEKTIIPLIKTVKEELWKLY